MVAKISNIFLVCLRFLIFFGVNGRCCARALPMKKESTPSGILSGRGYVHVVKFIGW